MKPAFKKYLLEATGAELYPVVLDALANSDPVISIRLNPYKPVPPELDSVVNIARELNDKVPWCSDGYYLRERPSFTHDPSYHAGAYYVQEASSMAIGLLSPFLNERHLRSPFSGQKLHSPLSKQHLPSLLNESNLLKPLRVLDLCAAPGGKSTHLISMLPLDSYIVVNEVVRGRLETLKENICKWGNHSVHVTSKEARFFADCVYGGVDGAFDFILVDAPCSGEGMFRKNPDAIAEWSEENVRFSAQRQRSILTDIWPALAPGGYLAFSTCTFNIYENDHNIRWLQDEFGAIHVDIFDSIDLNCRGLLNYQELGIVKGKEGGYRFFPGLVRGEGLFIALFQKPLDSAADSDYSTVRRYSMAGAVPSKKFAGKRKKKGSASGKKLTSVSGKRLTSVSDKEMASLLGKSAASGGFPQEEIVAEEAFSLNRDGRWPMVELSKEQALRYLARESIVLDGAPLGVLMVTYGGLPLGYVKNIGNRANNLYPKKWRIRSTLTLPEFFHIL